MEQPTLCLPDRICQADSELRVVLQQLTEAHGIPAVKHVLHTIEAANQVENTRSRGRPPGPAIDDLPALQEAAAIWRQQGSGPVWPALTTVAKSLRGEPESNARRLYSRLLETGPRWNEDFERVGIDDLRSAVFDKKIRRAIHQAGPRYLSALVKAISNLYHDDLDELWWVESVRNVFGFLTLEDIRILIQPSPAFKVFPCHLIRLNSNYTLFFGRMQFPKQNPPKIVLQDSIVFNELTITDLSRKVMLQISEESTSHKAIYVDMVPYQNWNYLVSRYDRPRKSTSPSSVSSAAETKPGTDKTNLDFPMELSAMHWTDDIPEFNQTMFKFDGDELREADRLAKVVSKMVIDSDSSSSTALAAFVLLLGDYIASNVDGDRWAEALDALGLLVQAALARVGLKHGLLKRGCQGTSGTEPIAI